MKQIYQCDVKDLTKLCIRYLKAREINPCFVRPPCSAVTYGR